MDRPFRFLRTPKREAILLRIAQVLCALGVFICSLALLAPGTDRKSVFLAMLIIFVGFVLLFHWINPVRQALITRLHQLGIRLAGRRLDPLRKHLPAEVSYEFSGSTLTSTWKHNGETVLSKQRDLKQLAYGLLGRNSVLLFTSNRQLKPLLILQTLDLALIECLVQAGVELETLSPELLPPSTIHHEFPAEFFEQPVLATPLPPEIHQDNS